MKKIFIFFNLILLTSLFTITSYGAEGDIVGPDVIYKEANKVLTLSSIIPLYSSSLDEIEVLNDNYTGFGDVPGIYTINLGVANNTQTKQIEVSVRNTIGNVIAVTQTGDSYTIQLHKNFLLTQNDIIDVLVNVQMFQYTSTTEIYILTDTYSDNASAPGTYMFEFNMANAAGLEALYEVYIQVNNTEKLLPDIVEETTDVSNVLQNIFYIALSIGALIGSLYLIRKLSRSAKARKGLLR